MNHMFFLGSYVVDAADRDSVPISRSELHDLLLKSSLNGIPLLVLGNKIDKSEALSKQSLVDQLWVWITTTIVGSLRTSNQRSVCYPQASNLITVELMFWWSRSLVWWVHQAEAVLSKIFTQSNIWLPLLIHKMGRFNVICHQNMASITCTYLMLGDMRHIFGQW